MYRKILILLIVVWGCVTGVRAIPFISRFHVSMDHEHVQGKITHILQGRDGLLWFSSFNGLHRFDGYSIVKYKSFPLLSNRIQRIYENSNGDIWCLSSDRIYLFNKQTERFVDVQPALDSLTRSEESPIIEWVYALEKGVTWMIGRNGECFRVKDDAPMESCIRMEFELESNTDILQIFTDKQGREWLMTRKGAFTYGQSEAASPAAFRYAHEAGGRLWMADTTGTIAYLNSQTGDFISIPLPGSPQRIYHQLLRDSLIYTSTEKGLMVTDARNGRTAVVWEMELSHFGIDRKGNVWATTPERQIVRLTLTGSGIECWATEVTAVSLPSDVSFTDYRLHFKQDEQGGMWLLFYDNTDILFFDEEKNAFIRPPGGMSEITRGLYGFFEDNQGGVWYRLSTQMVRAELMNTPFSVRDTDEKSEVRSMTVDRMGRIWLGLRNGEIMLYSSAGERIGWLGKDGRITSRKQVCGIVAYALMCDSRGRLWAGCRNTGLHLFVPTEEPTLYVHTHYLPEPHKREGLQDEAIYTILEDSRHNIWIGTLGHGLHLWREEGGFAHPYNGLGGPMELQPMNIRHLSEPIDGVIAICAKEGFYTFSNEFASPEEIRFHRTSKGADKNSLSENDVMSLTRTKNGDIWLCTGSGGINRLTSPIDSLLGGELTFERYGQKQGVASDVVYSAIEDAQGYLWLTGVGALTRFNPNTGEMQVYDREQMGREIKFSELLPYKLGEKILVGTVTGLMTFRPDDATTDRSVSPLVFLGLTIQNQPAFDRLKENGTVTLEPEERNLTLEFAALDYRTGTERIRYAYQLEGVDEGWNYTDENSVAYMNLPPGKHRFTLKATNGSGVWSGESKTLLIDVKPKLWESTLGYILMVIGLLGLVVVAFALYRRFYLLRHKLEAEQEMTDTKLRFFTEISHELRTPLTLIDGPLTEMMGDEDIKGKSRQYLEIVKKNSSRMMDLVNQILDIRRLQAGKMVMLVEAMDLESMLKRIVQDFNPMAERQRIDLNITRSGEPLQILWADKDKIEKIFMNLLANAFKYTPQGKKIEVRLSQTEKWVNVKVRDEGSGIEPEKQEKLFGLYETEGKENRSKPSSGIGLALVKQFVEMHHGKVTLESEVGKGSCFTVSLRKGKKHFTNDGSDVIVGDNEMQPDVVAASPMTDTVWEKETEETEDNLSVKDDKPTVLVVEDNSEMRSFIGSILSAKYRIIKAADGEEGWSLAQKEWPDLIVSDVMMPGMDGVELLKRVRQDENLYIVPVILLTARTAIADRIEGIQAGADDYVTKPFSANFLKAKVDALIENRRVLKARLIEWYDAQRASGEKIEKKNSTELIPSMPVITSADEQFIHRVMQYMEEHIDDASLNLSSFTAAMNMGRTAFTGKMKALLGFSPMDFVTDMRMKRAAQLLGSREFTVSEVAYKTGFNNPKYFSTCFKKYYGYRPSEFK